MSEDRINILSKLAKAGIAHLNSHVEHGNGKHGTCWIDVDALYANPTLASIIFRRLGKKFKDEKIDFVVGLERRGSIMAFCLARYLSKKDKMVAPVYATRIKGGVSFFGSKVNMQGKRILIVDDAIMTGITATALVTLVREANPSYVAFGVLCNGADVAAKEIGDIDKMEALFEVDLATWEKNKCPMCLEDWPIEKSFCGDKEAIDRR